jgi:selenocysteine lyase/cysteine desulfurase
MKGVEGKKEIEYSDWVPNRILYFATFVEELFNTKTKAEAFQLISDAAGFLKSLEGSRLQGGPAQNTFGSLFEVEEIRQDEIDFSNPDDDELRALEEEIVAAFEKAITPKTKIFHITHMVNWVGQIMPVKKLCDLAKKHNIETIVDGAHSFGLMDFAIPDLGCDYFGASLHKFLSAPIGSGMLWIKKEKIEKIWPLVCNDNPKGPDIRKFETLGTRSFPIEQGIGEAINFHTAIGSKRKEERIRYLKNYWATRVQNIPKVRINTSLKDEYACAICGVSIDGMTPGALDNALFNEYKIHTVGIVWENISCVRITPHVYTRLQDLDKLVYAIEKIAKKA